MHTISLFPSLLDYQMLGIFMLRLSLGLVFIYLWYTKITRGRGEWLHFFEKSKIVPAKTFFFITSTVEVILGALLIAGLWTQGVVIATGTIAFFAALIKNHRPSLLQKNTVEFYLLVAVLSFSLLFLGPGAFAVDWAL